jgi:tripartite-type tricarboxylate transporter receptor subunit TctC
MWCSWSELLAYGKANPGKLDVGNSGVGSVQHLTALVIQKRRGIDWGHVLIAAIRAVVANESNVILNGALPMTPFVAQSKPAWRQRPGGGRRGSPVALPA